MGMLWSEDLGRQYPPMTGCINVGIDWGHPNARQGLCLDTVWALQLNTGEQNNCCVVVNGYAIVDLFEYIKYGPRMYQDCRLIKVGGMIGGV